MPFRIVPERGKAPEYTIEPSKSESADVFHECVSGSKLANKAGILVPEPGALTRQPSAFTSDGNILARETARDDPITSGQVGVVDGSDVSEGDGIGESQGIDLDCIGVNLRIVMAVEVQAGPFRAEMEAADACEEVEEVGRHLLPLAQNPQHDRPSFALGHHASRLHASRPAEVKVEDPRSRRGRGSRRQCAQSVPCCALLTLSLLGSTSATSATPSGALVIAARADS